MNKIIIATLLVISSISIASAQVPSRCWNQPIPGTIHTTPVCIK